MSLSKLPFDDYQEEDIENLILRARHVEKALLIAVGFHPHTPPKVTFQSQTLSLSD
jgi:hypothetical protein